MSKNNKDWEYVTLSKIGKNQNFNYKKYKQDLTLEELEDDYEEYRTERDIE